MKLTLVIFLGLLAGFVLSMPADYVPPVDCKLNFSGSFLIESKLILPNKQERNIIDLKVKLTKIFGLFQPKKKRLCLKIS